MLLGVTGGLSLVQMFVLSYKSDDWGSIFGDPTKLVLGFFSILFDILFMVQHYGLHRYHSNYAEIKGQEVEVFKSEGGSTTQVFG